MYTAQPEKKYLIYLLSSIINDFDPDPPPEDLDWSKLYAIAEKHKISNMIYYGISKLDSFSMPPNDIFTKFFIDYKKAVAKEAVQHAEVENIKRIFEKNNIDYIVLKGYILKSLYPCPDMRQMADIDILIKDKDLKKINNIMIKLGYIKKDSCNYHEAYQKIPYMNIEIHKALVSESSPYCSYVNNIWDKASPTNNSKNEYQLPPEDFLIYLFIHLTKHYTNGGTGIRSIMDINIYNKYFYPKLNWDYIKEELNNIKLTIFENNILGLCNVWFGDELCNEIYDKMSEYIFSSGQYGVYNVALLSSLCNYTYKKNSIFKAKLLYEFYLFFPPLSAMRTQCHILKSFPFLLPVFWIFRFVRCFLFRLKHSLKMVNIYHNVTDKDVDKLKYLHKIDGAWN
ncbi:MAG: nucleotidyltransferase family protein [Bacillota bacterium]|nr:nucleotidyltransferase family protein [Bacillota bacterium]